MWTTEPPTDGMLNRQHWIQTLAIVGTFTIAIGTALCGAVLWIDSTIHGFAETAMQVQGTNEKRLTALEIEQSADTIAQQNLTAALEKLRDAEDKLAGAVDLLSDRLTRRR